MNDDTNYATTKQPFICDGLMPLTLILFKFFVGVYHHFASIPSDCGSYPSADAFLAEVSPSVYSLDSSFYQRESPPLDSSSIFIFFFSLSFKSFTIPSSLFCSSPLITNLFHKLNVNGIYAIKYCFQNAILHGKKLGII